MMLCLVCRVSILYLHADFEDKTLLPHRMADPPGTAIVSCPSSHAGSVGES